MKIGFLLGCPGINGGTYVIYEHASRLRNFGHTVFIITREEVNSSRYAWHPDAHLLQWITLEEGKKIVFDLVLATWWESPFLLHHLDSSHYVYFVQSVESRFWPPENPADHDARLHSLGSQLCESTYTYSIPVITEAGWIKKYLYDKYNTTASLVRNGIRKDLYRADGNRYADPVPGKLRVLVEGPVEVKYKNVPRTIELCRQADIDEVWLLTSSEIDSFPGIDRVFSCVPIHDTPSIYRSCDILVKLSYIEGMFGPPLEMFHCGGTALVYEVTGHDEYIVDGVNGYVVARDDEDAVISHLRTLKKDRDELARLKTGALDTAANWHDWKVSSRELEQALEKIAQGETTSRAYLKHHTAFLFEQHDLRISRRDMRDFSSRESQENDDGKVAGNFVQLYWHSGEGWSQEKCKWVHYRSGKWVTASLELYVVTGTITLRIDPSVRIGIFMLQRVQVTSLDSGETLLALKTPEDFIQVDVTGTACSLGCTNGNIFLSYGNDPQLVLPRLSLAASDKRLKITVVFKEMGVKQFFHDTVVGGPSGTDSLSKRIQGIFKRML